MRISVDDLSIALKNSFGDQFVGHYSECHNFRVELDELLPLMERLKKEYEFNFLCDITAVDRLDSAPDDEKRFEVVYILSRLSSVSRLIVRLQVDDEIVPSIAPLWSAAKWAELEVTDLFGVRFGSDKISRLISYPSMEGHPLRKDFSPGPCEHLNLSDISFSDAGNFSHIVDGNQWINIGPFHPAINSAFRLMAEMRGEIIERAKIEIGLNHRGIEKSFEKASFHNVTAHSTLLSSCSPVISNVAVARALESSFGIDIPPRAQALRMIFIEFSRIADHYKMLSDLGKRLHSDTFYSYSLEYMELIRSFFAKMTGDRFASSFIKFGGVARTLPLGLVADGFELLASLEKSLPKLEKIFNRSAFWADTLQISAIDRNDAIDWGLTGPTMRSAGINYDLRKRVPFYFYSDLDFEVPQGIDGTIYERYLVRIEEIRQSLKIIAQLLDYIPSGELMVGEFPTEVASSEVYSAIEGSNGEIGVYLCNDGISINRLRFRAPGLYAAQFFPSVAMNSNIDDALLGLLSLGIDPLELDR